MLGHGTGRGDSTPDAAAYARDGVVVARRLVEPAMVARLAAAVDRAMAAPGEHALDFNDRGTPGRFFGDMLMWRRDADFRAAFFETRVAAEAGRLMGAREVRLFYDQIFAKEPSTPARTPWHQDFPYWPVEGRQLCTAYLALDPVDDGNGAVEYVAGSQRWGTFRQAPFREGGADARRYTASPLAALPDIDARHGELDVRRFALAPGDAVIFDARLIHGAPGNPSARRRRTLALRLAGDDVVWRPHAGAFKALRAAGLAPGAKLGGEMFPLLWSAADGAG